MKEQNYKRFYDTVDRENQYSDCKNARDHAFSQVLDRTIKQYSLKNKIVLEIGSGNGRFQNVVKNYTGIDVTVALNDFYQKPFYVVEDGN